MERIFQTLESTMNKTSNNDLSQFFYNHKNVTKWFVCSDYCFNDPEKPNNVISFTLFPYIFNIDDWNSIVSRLEPCDLKKTKTIDPKFCEFLKSGLVFNISIILEDDNFLDSLLSHDNLRYIIEQYSSDMKKWCDETTYNKELYISFSKKLSLLLEDMKKKSFNYKLLRRMFIITYFASYIKYRLILGTNEVEMYSWLSDRDSITSWNNEVYQAIYRITSHTLLYGKLPREKVSKHQEAFMVDANKNMFYDGANRISDYICGALADYDYNNNRVTAPKHNMLIEDAISDNSFIVVLRINSEGASRIVLERI